MAKGPQVPGVGKQAKRHDLETPSTPPQSGSDLQQGDTQLFQEGQRVQPIKPQPQRGAPQQGTPAPQNAPRGQDQQVPDVMQFAGERLGGSASQSANTGSQRIVDVDPRRFFPIVKQIANSPGGGGTIAAAYIEQLSRIANSPTAGANGRVIDRSLVDEALERVIESASYRHARHSRGYRYPCRHGWRRLGEPRLDR